jgi:hypothetical protein
MKKGYENLFIAIWLNAINDDTKRAAKQLYDYAFDSVYETYNLNAIKPLDRDDEKFEDMKNAIRSRSNKMVKKLVPRIKELVYEESKEWPSYINFKKNDPEYNSIFKKLKEDILKFAQNEMSKFQKTYK